MTFDNPFLLGSGPPGTNGKVIARSYDLGWGGMVCKTFSLDASKVINTAPRYAKLRGRHSEEVMTSSLAIVRPGPTQQGGHQEWVGEERQGFGEWREAETHEPVKRHEGK